MFPHAPLSGPTPITTCPHCSMLVEGSCVTCAPGDTHPSCRDCEEGRYKPPWYRHNLSLTIFTTVVVSVASGLIIARVNSLMKKR